MAPRLIPGETILLYDWWNQKLLAPRCQIEAHRSSAGPSSWSAHVVRQLPNSSHLPGQVLGKLATFRQLKPWKIYMKLQRIHHCNPTIVDILATTPDFQRRRLTSASGIKFLSSSNFCDLVDSSLAPGWFSTPKLQVNNNKQPFEEWLGFHNWKVTQLENQASTNQPTINPWNPIIFLPQQLSDEILGQIQVPEARSHGGHDVVHPDSKRLSHARSLRKSMRKKLHLFFKRNCLVQLLDWRTWWRFVCLNSDTATSDRGDIPKITGTPAIYGLKDLKISINDPLFRNLTAKNFCETDRISAGNMSTHLYGHRLFQNCKKQMYRI